MIETERLILRPFEPGDLETLTRWNADPALMRHMGGPKSAADSAAALDRYLAHWREHGFGLLVARERGTGAAIGRTGLHFHRAWPDDPEVGWKVDRPWQGRGLATEMGAACLRWGFELGFDRLVSITTEENVASRRVMAKLGFELHTTVPFPELGVDLWVHALDRERLYP